jgi:lipopolysaccharide transport system ATP-binding protein
VIEFSAPSGSIIGAIVEGAWPFDDAKAGKYILENTLGTADAITKAKAIARMMESRGAGSTILLASHDEPLLEACADEIWWLRDGAMIARGDPAEVLGKYRAYVADALRSAGSGQKARVAPSMRKGDGRAALEQIELLGENGQPSIVWRSGEAVSIAVTVRFASRVKDPVVGIMIRTRVGLNVYGTNTELEHLKLGPVDAGAVVRVVYQFRCELCPGQYTVTAASHDPDGLWHDWLEDAVAFSVTDSRYTAGVVNLRATVSAESR